MGGARAAGRRDRDAVRNGEEKQPKGNVMQTSYGKLLLYKLILIIKINTKLRCILRATKNKDTYQYTDCIVFTKPCPTLMESSEPCLC